MLEEMLTTERTPTCDEQEGESHVTQHVEQGIRLLLTL